MSSIFTRLEFETAQYKKFQDFLKRAFQENKHLIQKSIVRRRTRFYKNNKPILSFNKLVYFNDVKPSINYIMFYSRDNEAKDYGNRFSGKDKLNIYASYTDSSGDREDETLFCSIRNSNDFFRFTSNDIAKHSTGQIYLTIHNEKKGIHMDSLSQPNIWISEYGKTFEGLHSYMVLQFNDSVVDSENSFRTDYANMGALLIFGPSVDVVTRFEFPQILISLDPISDELEAADGTEQGAFARYINKYVRVMPQIRKFASDVMVTIPDAPEGTVNMNPIYDKVYSVLQYEMEKLAEYKQLNIHHNLLTN